ncbi:MAG: toprim domain-containing protein [Methanimicrococcus sp.]|nr:toprim domain-containing protein [Methanimicrococcus sp.]
MRPDKNKRVSDRDAESLKAVEEVLSALNGDAENSPKSPFLIIVEGRRDILSLRNLGIKEEIEIVKCANRPTAEFCEKIAETGKEAVILTDWDRKGGILASRLAEQFQNLNVSYHTEYRETLLFYTKKEIKDVESLFSYVGKLKNPDDEDEIKEFG